MMFAVKKDNMAVLNYLLQDESSDVNAKGPGGNTALHYACSNGNLEAAKLLCWKGGADINRQSNDGWTPLMWSVYTDSVEVSKFLHDTGQTL